MSFYSLQYMDDFTVSAITTHKEMAYYKNLTKTSPKMIVSFMGGLHFISMTVNLWHTLLLVCFATCATARMFSEFNLFVPFLDSASQNVEPMSASMLTQCNASVSMA